MATTTTKDLIPTRVGESRNYAAHGRTFTVKRLSATTWHLADDAVRSRSRFGTRSEITADVAVTLEYGCLPNPSMNTWS